MADQPVNTTQTMTRMTTEEAAKRRANAPRAKVVTDKTFIREALEAHNKCRAKHNANKLILGDELCQVAQAYASKLAQSGDNFQHSGNGYGENIFFTTEGPLTGKMPTGVWYSEGNNYDWSNIDKQKGTSHFTQMIWKSTETLGIANAMGKFGMYVVANYFPPGNVKGKYKENIEKSNEKKK